MKLAANEWPIIVCGPPIPELLYESRKTGEELIVAMTGKAYPVDQLRKWARRFKGLPVFSEHAPTAIGHNGNPRPYDSPDVGYIKSSGFNQEHRRVQAILKVVNPDWQNVFSEAWVDGSINQYGFSMLPDVYPAGTVTTTNGVKMPKVEIANIYSVDLTDQPYFGGRFMGVDPPLRWLEYALDWRDQHV